MAQKKKVKRKKNRVGRALFRLVLLVCVFGLLIFGAVKLFGWLTGVVTGNRQTVTLYFYDDVIGTLVPVERSIKAGSDLPSAVVGEILNGPTVADHAQRTVAAGTTLNSLTNEEGVVTVNLSKSAQTPAPPCTEEYSLYSIVNSLCQLEGVKSVKFQVDAQTPPMYWDVYRLDQEFKKQEITIPPTQQVGIFFPEKRGRYVVLEQVTVRKTDSVAELARLVMRRYIQGPKNPMLRGTLPVNLKLPSMSFSSGLLKVNFSSDGLNLSTDAAGEQIFAQSLIWTLTDVRNVNKVRVLVDDKSASPGGHISWKDDFTRLDQRLVDSPTDSMGDAALVYYAADFGDGLYAPVPRIRFLTGPAFDREPLDRLFDGTDPTERELGLISCAPPDTKLLGVKFNPDSTIIDVSAQIGKSLNQSSESTFVRQIVLTATDSYEQRNIPVTISIEGDENRESLPYGTLTRKISRQP